MKNCIMMLLELLLAGCHSYCQNFRFLRDGREKILMNLLLCFAMMLVGCRSYRGYCVYEERTDLPRTNERPVAIEYKISLNAQNFQIDKQTKYSYDHNIRVDTVESYIFRETGTGEVITHIIFSPVWLAFSPLTLLVTTTKQTTQFNHRYRYSYGRQIWNYFNPLINIMKDDDLMEEHEIIHSENIKEPREESRTAPLGKSVPVMLKWNGKTQKVNVGIPAEKIYKLVFEHLLPARAATVTVEVGDTREEFELSSIDAVPSTINDSWQQILQLQDKDEAFQNQQQYMNTLAELLHDGWLNQSTHDEQQSRLKLLIEQGRIAEEKREEEQRIAEEKRKEEQRIAKAKQEAVFLEALAACNAGEATCAHTYTVGMGYLEGVGTERNIDKGIQYLDASSRGGNHEASYQLGDMYASTDMRKAMDYLLLSRKQGGIKCDQKIQEIIRSWEENSRRGDHEASYQLGDMYASTDTRKAMDYFLLSQKQGGTKCDQKIREIIQPLERRSRKGDHEASYQLGLMFANTDTRKAIDYFLLSKKQGGKKYNHGIREITKLFGYKLGDKWTGKFDNSFGLTLVRVNVSFLNFKTAELYLTPTSHLIYKIRGKTFENDIDTRIHIKAIIEEKYGKFSEDSHYNMFSDSYTYIYTLLIGDILIKIEQYDGSLMEFTYTDKSLEKQKDQEKRAIWKDKLRDEKNERNPEEIF